MFIYLYKQSLINTTIMENQTEYILIKELTKKLNRKNVLKVIGQAAVFVGLAYASMYMFLYFMLWANDVSDKIIGIISN